VKVLCLGSGPSTKYYSPTTFKGYDALACINGSVLAACPAYRKWPSVDFYFGTDWGCRVYDWFSTGVLNSGHLIMHIPLRETVERILGARREAVPVEYFYMFGTETAILKPPGEETMDYRDYGNGPVLACHGTGLHAMLHYFTWRDDVESITLLGFDHLISNGGHLHFYDTPPLNAGERVSHRRKWKEIAKRSATAVKLTLRRKPVYLHKDDHGVLRDILPPAVTECP